MPIQPNCRSPKKHSDPGLRWWLQPKDRIFSALAQYVQDTDNPAQRRVFIDRGAPVILLAHVDTVLHPSLHRADKDRVFAQGLDDRLGCAVAWLLSKELNTDLLLTDLEETGQTTAAYHDFSRYNWIAEFDRAGRDVVTYGLETADWLAALAEYWPIGYGTYSDIASIDTTVCAVNIGIGYHQAHMSTSYFDVPVLRKQLARFRRFYRQHKDTRFALPEVRTPQYTRPALPWYILDIDAYSPVRPTYDRCDGCFDFWPQDKLTTIDPWGPLCPKCLQDFDDYMDMTYKKDKL